MTSTARSSRSRTRHHGAAAVALAAAGGAAHGCSSGDTSDNPLDGDKAEAGTVVVGSNNFAESTLLADIYGEALRAKGLKVTYKHNIGSRETTYGLMKNGSVTVLPEYNGSLLAYLDPKAEQTSADAVDEAVKAKLDQQLTLLESSPPRTRTRSPSTRRRRRSTASPPSPRSPTSRTSRPSWSSAARPSSRPGSRASRAWRRSTG